MKRPSLHVDRKEGILSVSALSKYVSSKSLGFEESDVTVDLDEFESLAKGAGEIYKYSWLTLRFISPEVHTSFIQCELHVISRSLEM